MGVLRAAQGSVAVAQIAEAAFQAVKSFARKNAQSV
jgi:hypothetical protein